MSKINTIYTKYNHEGEKFYMAASFNLPNNPNGGAILARTVARKIEELSKAHCVSRWFYHLYLENSSFYTAAVADIIDISSADFVVVLPLTKTSRGTHVELGIALALAKPVYLYSPPDRSPTSFDMLCQTMPKEWRDAIDAILEI